jgi:3-dehydroquinate dehydratase-2
MADILILHGPNLNMLGVREPGIYGSKSLDDINSDLTQQAESLGISVDTFQSNTEGELVTRIQQAYQESVKFIIINPAAYTHTSVAMRDALLSVKIPFIEVHLSNVHQRETFRHHSYFSDKAVAVICGLGADGYSYALDAAYKRISQAK